MSSRRQLPSYTDEHLRVLQLYMSHNNKQLLDEAEHDIKNYSDRGQCYLPKRS
jgi:hypothetical protein